MKGRVQEIWLAWPPMLYQRDGLSWADISFDKAEKRTGASRDASSAGKAHTSCDGYKRGLQLRSTWLSRLLPPAASQQREVPQIASLTQANGPSCALAPPGCCSVLQERVMIVRIALT